MRATQIDNSKDKYTVIRLICLINLLHFQISRLILTILELKCNK